jgi:hypothetical protein
MIHDEQNDLNVADKPEHVKIIESLSKQMRDKFPVQYFTPPPADTSKKKRAVD